MSQRSTSTEAAVQVIAAAQHLFEAAVMSHSGHGNLSARLDEERFVLSATGMVRQLAPDQFATLNLEGKVLAGELGSENAEIVAMHATVYRLRPAVGGIIHAHSPAATAFALAHRELPCRAEPLLRFGQAESVPVVPWGPRGSEVSVRGIAAAIQERPGTAAVLLANHGLLTFGASPMETARLVVAIEEAAEAELAAAVLGGAVDFPEGALAAVRESMARAGR